jgi:hypothetical protein
MDCFQLNAITQKLEGGSMFHEAFALMGYLNDNGNFMKRMGYMTTFVKNDDDKWNISFVFQDMQNQLSVWCRESIDTKGNYPTVKSIVEEIASIENESFKYLGTGKILGIHHEEMPNSYQRKFKIQSLI